MAELYCALCCLLALCCALELTLCLCLCVLDWVLLEPRGVAVRRRNVRKRQQAQSTATNAVAMGGEGSRGTVAVEQDPGRNSNSSAPDHSGGETSANSAGGDGFSGGCEREQREAGKRKRCEEQAATEQVRAQVQRYQRMTDGGGGRVGEQLEVQVQEKPWRRARKRKRQEVSESETRGRCSDKENATGTQDNRNIETLRTNTLSMAAHAGRRNNKDRYIGS
jgi:hypothetical protein